MCGGGVVVVWVGVWVGGMGWGGGWMGGSGVDGSGMGGWDGWGL